MRTLTPPGASRGSSEQAPVFADLSGRRRRRMRLLGLGAGAVMAACLAVMAAGLLGGPKASLIPWARRGGAGGPATASAPGAAGTAPPQLAPFPVTQPSPAPDRPPGAGGSSSPAAGGSSSPAASASPSASVTNRASKTPPGLNHTKTPHPSPTKHASAV